MGTMPWRQVSAERKEKKGLDEPPAYRHGVDEVSVPEKISTDNTHRNLKPRHIQLIGIGGTIGTALFVQIGRGLLSGGPASLFLAFSWWYVSPSTLHIPPTPLHAFGQHYSYCWLARRIPCKLSAVPFAKFYTHSKTSKETWRQILPLPLCWVRFLERSTRNDCHLLWGIAMHEKISHGPMNLNIHGSLNMSLETSGHVRGQKQSPPPHPSDLIFLRIVAIPLFLFLFFFFTEMFDSYTDNRCTFILAITMCKNPRKLPSVMPVDCVIYTSRRLPTSKHQCTHAACK